MNSGARSPVDLGHRFLEDTAIQYTTKPCDSIVHRDAALVRARLYHTPQPSRPPTWSSPR
eukprot:2230100-Prymnesium_polylepis.1